MYYLIDIYDIVIIPFLIILIILGGRAVLKKINDPFLKRVFKFGLSLKILASICVVILVNYYGFGDTLAYFEDTASLSNVIVNNPQFTYQVITNIYADLPTHIQSLFPDDYIFQQENINSGRVATFGVIPYLLFFNSYWGINFIFSLFAFAGTWKLFNVLIEIYPETKKKLALILFFIPSIVFWSSGFLKDPLSQGALMFILYAFIKIFYLGQSKLKYYLVLLIAIRIIIIIKSYIFLMLMPFLLILVFNIIKNRKATKQLVKYILNFLLVFILFYVANTLFKNPDIIGRFAIDTILEEIQMQKEGYANLEQGSFINLAEFDGSALGLLKMIPVGLEVVFLRPYIWEARNFLMAFAALENFIVYYFIYKILTAVRFNILYFIKKLKEEKLILSLFVYSILLGSFIGLSNPNFGTISRYRIPATSILLITLVILEHNINKSKKELNKNV